jgi:glycosyltransferase involved in cell wall biosynthesis
MVQQGKWQAGGRPIRVLQIVENLDNQAVESWLFKVLCLSQEKHPYLEWTFFCVLGRPGKMDEAVRQMGAKVIHSPHDIGEKRAFLMALRQVMRQDRYDVLHCHHDIMSALPLLASIGLTFRRRIVHVHNTSIGLPTPNPLKAALVRAPFRQICLRADKIVGVSQDALDAMLAGHKRRPGRDCVIHCGIETHRFRRDENNVRDLRQSFSLGTDAKILLFVGRMIAYKNPNFVVEVLSHLHQKDARFAAVFAGTGPFEDKVRELARQKRLQERVCVLGWRQDVPELMQACDLLIWPGVEEPKEGLGLGIVEAQAAGLPVLMSRNVPEEAVVVPELVKILPLSEGPQAWAEAVIALFQCARPARHESLARVEASSFSIEQSADNIAALYDLPSK